MRAFRFGAATVTLGAASALVAMQVIGCGGDDSTNPSSPDGSTEASMTDATMFVDAPSPPSEASPEEDAGGDAEPIMTRDAEAGTPQGDGGDGGSDSGTTCAVAVPTAAQFFQSYASTLCQSLKGCCNTGPKFDMASCLSIYAVPGSGGLLGVGQPSKFLDGGRMGYDPNSACQCLEAVSALNCGSVLQDTLNSIQQTCLAAVHGTATIASTADAGDGGDAGQSVCASSYECVTGAYCTKEYANDPAPDASLGSCEPLLADGGACASTLQCSYLTNGLGALHCNPAGTCGPRAAPGVTCVVNSDCASNLCISASCATGEVLASPALCSYFTVPDAGDGG